MTESEWLTCDDPALMLAFLRDKSSEWKLRLFVCACCREMWRFLDGQHIRIEEERRQAVEVAERFADGQATHEELAQASEIAERFRYTAAEEANKAMSAMNHQDYNWFAVHNAKSFAASAAAASVAVDIAESTITAIEAARNAAATTCLGSLEAS